MSDLISTIQQWLNDHTVLGPIVGLSVLLLAAIVVDVVARRQVVRLVKRMVTKTRSDWDDELARHRVFQHLTHLITLAVVYFGVQAVPGLQDSVTRALRNLAAAFMVLYVLLAVGAALTAVNAIYERYPVSRNRPIKGYLQIAKIAVYIMGAVLIIATVFNKSPLLFLSGLGAMTAVLLLIFKDTILSLVASVQIASNDMIRVGDWVEMPQYNADGDIVDIALHSVRVRNWDKTTTTVPTHKFIAEPFKNWRSMPESGGRRIKRSIFIDERTISFLSDEETDRFQRFALLRDQVRAKKQELQEYNALLSADDSANVNARRLTNIGTFRAYVLNYLKNHPHVHQNMTLLVRQLAPTPQGLPLEIYIFTNKTDWIAYEDIQSDIFDHIIAILPEFGLRVFQNPSGNDIEMALGRLGSRVSGAAGE